MVIGIGETVLDIIFKNDQPQMATPGGSTFNAIISIGRMRLPCTIVTEVGDDYVGDITCKYLRDNGVDDSFVDRHEGIKSHVSLAFLNESNDAQYQFYKDHAKTTLSSHCPAFTKDDVVLFGSFFAVNPVIRKEVGSMLQKANKQGAMLYYDVNFRASHISEIPDIIGNIQENMRLSTIVRGSLEDFQYLYGIDDVDEIYLKHILPSCPYFICTNGAKYIELRTPTLQTYYTVQPIETVSTVGAGDNFNAGFIYALTKKGLSGNLAEWDKATWDEVIAIAQKFSANVCQQFGNSVDRTTLQVES